MRRMQFLSMTLSLAPFAGWVSAPDVAVIPNLSSVKEYPGSLRIHRLQGRSFDTPAEGSVEWTGQLQASAVPVRADLTDEIIINR